MKREVCISVFLITAGFMWGQTQDIRLNSLGYLPVSSKKASVITKCSSFVIKDVADGKVVFEGTVTDPVYQKDVGQHVWIADFSELASEGDYIMEIPHVGKSIEFRIANDVYNRPFHTVFRSLYLFRCGTALEGEYNGSVFRQKPCHLNDGYTDYIGIAGSKLDGTGGWHDAGDYGKYTANAAFSLGIMFMAWDHFKDNLENVDFDLPETAPGFPDYLEEMKWETDWLLKMQYPDGSGRVSHKLTPLNFEGFIPAGQDMSKRFFSEWSSTSVADFAACMASAARYFKNYDSAYAEKCLNAARRSYKFLQENPGYKPMNQSDFRTGAYASDDADDRMWAAAELWETTGEESYLKDLEKRIKQFKNMNTRDWDWDYLAPLGIFTYLLSEKSGKDQALYESFREQVLKDADSLVSFVNNDVYGRSHTRYYWGTNGLIPRLVINLHIAGKLSHDEKYTLASQDIIAHIFGRNYYNRSYVTGVGYNPPMHPHDRRSVSDSVVDPWPGYMVGGGHTATDWVDQEIDYSRNEIALNWQTSLIYALAKFIDSGNRGSND